MLEFIILPALIDGCWVVVAMTHVIILRALPPIVRLMVTVLALLVPPVSLLPFLPIIITTVLVIMVVIMLEFGHVASAFLVVLGIFTLLLPHHSLAIHHFPFRIAFLHISDFLI